MKKEEQAPGTERVSVTLVVDFAGFGKPANVHVEGCPPRGAFGGGAPNPLSPLRRHAGGNQEGVRPKEEAEMRPAKKED